MKFGAVERGRILSLTPARTPPVVGPKERNGFDEQVHPCLRSVIIIIRRETVMFFFSSRFSSLSQSFCVPLEILMLLSAKIRQLSHQTAAFLATCGENTGSDLRSRTFPTVHAQPLTSLINAVVVVVLS